MGASKATRLAILTAMDGDSTRAGRAGETPIYIIRPGQTMPLDWPWLFIKTLNEDDHRAISESRAVGGSSLPYGEYPIGCLITGIPYSLNIRIKPPCINTIYW
jgi:hypothetical protein